jgi:hypothetical protein
MAVRFTRAQTTATNRQKFTLSMWVKRGVLDIQENIFGSHASGSDEIQMQFNGDDQLYFLNYPTTTEGELKTTARFRDSAAYYNIVIAGDTTQAVAADRLKVYINGSQLDSANNGFATDTYPPQNNNFAFGTSSYTFVIGTSSPTNTNDPFTGLMSYVAFVDGTAYDASYFGETDASSGIWKIKTAPSVTYGNNGFYLKMDTATPTADSSGNDNTFTSNGTPTLTQDNPSNVFCVANPVDNYYPGYTFQNANTTSVTGSNYSYNQMGMYLNKGKWYWECKVVSKGGGGDEYMIGIQGKSVTATNSPAQNNYGYTIYATDGDVYAHSVGTTSYGSAYTAGDIIGVALDCTNNKLYWSKNGVWMGSGDPSAGTNGFSVVGATTVPQGGYSPVAGFYSSNGATFNWNFGNGFFGTTQVTSSNADAAGYGLMEYAVPTGFYTICTKNLNTYG